MFWENIRSAFLSEYFSMFLKNLNNLDYYLIILCLAGGSMPGQDEDISPYATFHLLGMREEAKNGKILYLNGHLASFALFGFGKCRFLHCELLIEHKLPPCLIFYHHL